ncbi:MAG: hypothetical protein KDA76_07805 [Planctomycetaceae bacterium]|nr:hypothetical protein [Planctomycetaceae bacterium]
MEYALKPLSKTCSATGQPLEPGSLCYSVLIELNGRFERRDFSPEGWRGVPDAAVGVWRTQVPEAEVKAHPLRDLNQMVEMFITLVEQANDPQKKLRYVLALWLVRKKRLIHEETRETAEGAVMILTGAQGEGTFEIPEELISDFEMAHLQAQIQTLCQQDKRQAA